jgi:maltose alpha-D-glucosyltransferase/alpha-amylase
MKNQTKIFNGHDDPQWYKDAVIYQLHVKTFCDSNGDGIGDFKGLTSKLDYLQDLGVTALWLLPFCPSPLRDDGYDISDYKAVHPAYGTLRDFKAFLREAHRRELRVITELVVNHTSDQHPWFQRARRANSGSAEREFYVWSDRPDRYEEARILFKDFESSNWTWDPVAKAYFWHRFYSHQPDLNYDNPEVRKAVVDILDFWFEMGVDGLRLDAVPYLFEREGTNCENLPETHEFLRSMRNHVDRRFESRLLLGEANQWPEDAAAYFGSGDECHMAFHFPLMPRLFMALRMEDRSPIVDILEQTPSIPDGCQWATFLRNHDELTLEMVTDEERDYMYRVYAQDSKMRINFGIRRRLAPLLGNDRKRIELMNCLLFSMLGTPVIYYGDEIGMGDNIYLGDRNGVRTPMQWSPDRNAGFSQANPQQLYLPVIIDPEYSYETINVEAQQGNRHSLVWWMKRLISMRKRYKAFGRGHIEFINPDNYKILVYIRHYGHERILVVANLSRFVQYVNIDLSSYANSVPVELFGQMEFPRVGPEPYFLTLGPHSFYWFSLIMKGEVAETILSDSLLSSLPRVTVSGSWEQVFQGEAKAGLEKHLPGFLRKSRWFGGKAWDIKSVSVENGIPVHRDGVLAHILLLKVDYTGGTDERYVLALAYAGGERAEKIMKEHPSAFVLRLKIREKGEQGILFDALVEAEFGETLFEAIERRRHIKGHKGKMVATPTRRLRRLRKLYGEVSSPRVLKAEQTNTSIVYGEQFILKVIRRLDTGINPDLEIGLFLTEMGFQHIPAVAGAIEYSAGQGEPMTLAILEQFVPNEGDAWSYTLDVLGQYFERILARRTDLSSAPPLRGSISERIGQSLPTEWLELVGGYHESVRLLGQRTAELHVALGSSTVNPQFAPEPFSTLYQRSLYQSVRSLTRNVFRMLRRQLGDIEESIGPEAQSILGMEGDIIERLRAVLNHKISGHRIRCHGDYHLGQVLYTGKDFVIIDFEGEPAHPISERRIKRSPLRDVAGMLRSFHYAASSALNDQKVRGFIREDDMEYFRTWVHVWTTCVSTVFVKSYLDVAAHGNFLPESVSEIQILLDLYFLEKAIYELGYELNNRPDWIFIPLEGIRQLLRTDD